MTLIRWTPRGRNLSSTRDEFESLFEDFFRGFSLPVTGRFSHPAYGRFYPRVDIINSDNEVLVKAEVPGLSKDDLDISISNDVITIKGERKSEEESENECYYCKESTYGSFERQIQLPENVASDEAKASLENGILTLTLPKSEPKGSVKVEVN